MLSINHCLDIPTGHELVWQVIVDFDAYGEWNQFVPACRSSLVVGSPIVMKVKLLPLMTLTQKETILTHAPGELIEYGIQLPFGLLSSSRKHIVCFVDKNNTRYESRFQLTGVLSPLVKMMMGSKLQKGFTLMSVGLKSRAMELSERKES